jgi:hypothetical protein
MSEAKKYVSLVFEASDDFPNPFRTPHPFGRVVGFIKEDAVFEGIRLIELNAELLTELSALIDICKANGVGDHQLPEAIAVMGKAKAERQP